MKERQTKVVNGTTYDARTPDEVIRVLENARAGRYRVWVHYGYTSEADAADGVGRKQAFLDWLGEYDHSGYVGRSMGPTKIPLLVHNSRSMGGGGILDGSIIKIRRTDGGRVLYQHPQYTHGRIEVCRKPFAVELPDGRKLTVDVFQDGEVQASFENMDKARRYLHKLGLKAELVNIVEGGIAALYPANVEA